MCSICNLLSIYPGNGSNGNCSNVYPQCDNWASYGFCTTYAGWMSTNCKKACSKNVYGNDAMCYHWANDMGYCKTGPYTTWMNTNCGKACGHC